MCKFDFVSIYYYIVDAIILLLYCKHLFGILVYYADDDFDHNLNL